MKSINGAFFTTESRITDENKLRKEVYDRIKPFFTQGITKRVTALIDTMRMECYSPDLPLHHDRIHVKNGTLFLDGHFTPDKDYCRNRLPVSYNPNAPKPEKWLKFLSELLEPDDILTLQEFMGYCFIPSTKGQKMLLLIGKGGEGKSRIGLVLRSLLGANMNTGSISKVETSPFARADLEHELLLLDDDMKLEALPQTNNIKAIITAELPMDLERKGQQSYQGDLYVRFIGLGNGTLQSLYDRSVGFFRRQIILTTKDKPADRIDDPYIAEKMCAEAEGDISLGNRGTAQANVEQLPLHGQQTSRRKHGSGDQGRQQHRRVSVLRGIYPIQGGLRDYFTRSVRDLPSVV